MYGWFYFMGAVMTLGALLGAVMMIRPRLWIRLKNLWQYEEQPEPREWYLAGTALTGVILFLVFTAAAVWVFIMPAQFAEERRVKEVLMERCETLLPLLSAAAEIDPRRGVMNPDVLESVASTHNLSIEWLVVMRHGTAVVRDESVTPARVLFRIPGLPTSYQCLEFEVRPE